MKVKYINTAPHLHSIQGDGINDYIWCLLNSGIGLVLGIKQSLEDLKTEKVCKVNIHIQGKLVGWHLLRFCLEKNPFYCDFLKIYEKRGHAAVNRESLKANQNTQRECRATCSFF